MAGVGLRDLNAPIDAQEDSNTHNMPQDHGDGIGKVVQHPTEPGIGFVLNSDGSIRRRYLLRLHWVQGQDNIWIPSTWRWELDYSEKVADDNVAGGSTLAGPHDCSSDLAALVGSGATVPPEILLSIVETISEWPNAALARLCDDASGDVFALSAEEILARLNAAAWPLTLEDWSNLTNLALVCREWFIRCAPFLYYKISVQDSRVEEFSECVRRPNSHIPQHARALVVGCHHSWSLMAQLLRLLPGIIIICCAGEHGRARHPRVDPPVLAVSTASVLVALGTRLRVLALQRCTFPSTAELFRIVRALPSVTILLFFNVRVLHASNGVVISRLRSQKSRLSTMYLQWVHPDTLLPPLLLWTAPLLSSRLPMDTFPGLLPLESKFIADIVLLAVPLEPERSNIQEYSDVRLELEQSTTTPRTWILSATRYEASDEFVSMLEFHMSCTEDAAVIDPSPAHIHHIIYRDTTVLQLTDYSLQPSEALYSSLPHLRTVTVEARHLQVSDMSTNEDVPGLRDNLISVKSSLRTWKEGYDLTQGAIQDGTAADGSLPISPLWAHPRHKLLRNRCLTLAQKV